MLEAQSSMARTSVEVSDSSREVTESARLLAKVASVVVTTLLVAGSKIRQPFWDEIECP